MQGVEMAYQSGGGTNLPAAIALATDELTKQSGERKFLFLITDGESTHGPIRPVLDEAHKRGIGVIRVFLGKKEGRSEEFDHDIHVENPDELPEKLAALLEKDLLSGLSDARSRTVNYVHSRHQTTVAFARAMRTGIALVTLPKIAAGALIQVLAPLLHQKPVKKAASSRSPLSASA